jgi:hypothetical protein
MSSETFVDPVDVAGRPTRPAARYRGSWAGGLVLIALGALFLFNSSAGWHLPQSVWALPLFIAAAGAGLFAVRLALSNDTTGRGSVVGAATAAALLAFMGVVLLLGLNWRDLWPMFVIIPGVGLVAGRLSQVSPRARG